MQAKQCVKKLKDDKNLEKPKGNREILNFEPGMMLGRNLWVFIVFGTVTPSVRKCQVVQKMVCNNML